MSVTATSLPPNYTLPGRITDAAPELKRYSGPYNLARPLPDGEARISLYGYWPGTLLAYVALATFSVSLVLHLFWMFRHRTTRIFQGLLALGCVMEIIGYAFRFKNTTNPFVVNWFVINFFLIITAPVAFAAALYLALSIAVRTMKVPSILPMTPKKVVALFVFIDVTTTVTQCVGSGLIGIATSQKAKQQTPIIPVESANALLLTGLAVQCAGFIAFLAVVAITYVRNRRLRFAPMSQETLPVDEKDSAVIATSETEPATPIPGRFWAILLLTSLAIWTRTLFRMGETTEGVFGYASSHEALFATLEFTPVIISVLLWALFPLERLLR